MSESIMIVDDDVTIQVLLRVHLESLGFTCLVASDGREALAILDRTRIPLLITDLDMPGMAGLELMRQIRQRRLTTRCIVVTGYATLGNLTACLQEGAVALVPKPLVDYDLLDQAVNLAFEQIRLWTVQMKAILRLKPDEDEFSALEPRRDGHGR